MMYKTLKYAVVLVFSLVFAGCRDKCENRSADASFRIYQEMEYYDNNGAQVKQIEEDTFMIGTYVTFEALGNADQYEWQIGEDDRIRTDKKFTLFFNPVELTTTTVIPVRLTAKNTANAECFPNSNDTKTRVLTLLDTQRWPVFGKYYGSDNTSPDKKYTVEIFLGRDPAQPAYQYQMIKNLPGGAGGCNNLAGIGGAAFEFAIGISMYDENAKIKDCVLGGYDNKRVGWLSPDRNTITIDYAYTKLSENSRVKYHQVFTGKRVP